MNRSANDSEFAISVFIVTYTNGQQMFQILLLLQKMVRLVFGA